MPTECNSYQLEFEAFAKRRVIADFEGGPMTSDAGTLLLRHTDRAINLFDRVAACFTDHRMPELVEHQVRSMVGQRIAGITLGYEDINDHDDLRHDPVLAFLSDRLEPRREDCAVLAGKSTLNRLEHAPSGKLDRYHKIGHDPEKLENLFVDLFLEAHKKPPKRIILDLDATDDPLHGDQEGRFYHGYYDCYCYLPLYIFCGHQLLASKLRPADIDGAAGAREEIERIVSQIRARWPKVKIWLRADSGFARDELMTWCDANKVDYVFGLAKNSRLLKRLAPELAKARADYRASDQPARCFKDFTYRTRDSWSRRRRVIGKAEYLKKGPNPRFIVTSLKPSAINGRVLYEQIYCARGDMENRIKDCQLDLFADRTSSHTMRANQLRLWFSSFAHVLIETLRRLGLGHTRFANATPGTIRAKLLKIGAQVVVSVRRILVRMPSACPYQTEFALACLRLGQHTA